MKINKMQISKPSKEFAKDIYNLVKNTKVLDLNSEYLYLLQTTHFKNTCSMFIFEKKVAGFVSAYRIPDFPNKLFIWQVAVDAEFRGKGIAQKLILEILKREENKDIEYINTTVSPSNYASIKVFDKLTSTLQTQITSKSFLEKEDFTNQHEEEVLYEIGPFNLKEKNENI